MAALDVTGLCRSFGGLVVANGIDLRLDPGARTALIGPNGAGKTTLIDLISGQLKSDAGRIVLQDREITHDTLVRRVRSGLVRTFQISRLIPDMTVVEHLRLAETIQRGRQHVFWRPGFTREDSQHVDGVIEQMGLCQRSHRRISELAYGEQRLLEIAIALVLRPRVLLLDEPAAGVPKAESARIIKALDALPDHLAVLMIEHDMDLVFRFADRVVVMANGQIIFSGAPGLAKNDAEVRSAYLGTRSDEQRHA